MTPSLTRAPARPSNGAAMDWLGWVGVALATALGLVTAVWEAFLAPLAVQWTGGGHAHSARVPVALLGAVAVNAALVWLVRATTGRLVYVVGPFLAWTVVVVLASARTTEGDLVLTGNNWVAVVLIFVGAVTFVLAAAGLAVREARAAVAAHQTGRPGLAPEPPAR